jgi:hypothetical protein
VNTWNTNENIPSKRSNISPQKNQPIHVDTRSKIDTWNEQSIKVRIELCSIELSELNDLLFLGNFISSFEIID